MTQKGQQKVLEGQEGAGIRLSSIVYAKGGRWTKMRKISLFPLLSLFEFFSFHFHISQLAETEKYSRV